MDRTDRLVAMAYVLTVIAAYAAIGLLAFGLARLIS